MEAMDRTADNGRILMLMSRYLTEAPTFVDASMMRELADDGVDEETAFSLLAAAAVGLDVETNAQDRVFYRAYFPKMIRCLDSGVYERDAYYQNISLTETCSGDCVLRSDGYAPYEAFVCDDIRCLPDGREIPQIGFFPNTFRYPAVYEKERLWMSVSPNEINTMAKPVSKAFGRVLAFGLGLGYYPYMVSEKSEVRSVTVVENNPDVIALFESSILPQFPHADKIRIVHADAFAYAKNHFPKTQFDCIFTDLWHDVSDGLPMYKRMRVLAPLAPGARFDYWIERTLKCYL